MRAPAGPAAALVRAMLGAPGIAWHGGRAVARVDRAAGRWCLRDARGATLAEAELVVVAAGFDSLALLDDALPCTRCAARWHPAPCPAAAPTRRCRPFRSMATAAWSPTCRATRGRAGSPAPPSSAPRPRPRCRPKTTPPTCSACPTCCRAGAALAAQWRDGRAQAWAGVRATLPDRLPAGAWRWRANDNFEPNRAAAPAEQAEAAIDSISDEPLPIHLCTGLGARGLTLAVRRRAAGRHPARRAAARGPLAGAAAARAPLSTLASKAP
jgi:tRNA 5-methylaminomethyl-2-thiouridine biosynthesis bifunctional protein